MNKRSCGEVMFSQVSVCPKGGHVWQGKMGGRGICMAGGCECGRSGCGRRGMAGGVVGVPCDLSHSGFESTRILSLDQLNMPVSRQVVRILLECCFC